MPYKLRKAPKRDLYWVVAEDGTKKSKEPIPLERAEAQMRALYASENKKGKGVSSSKPSDITIKKEAKKAYRKKLEDDTLTPGTRFVKPEVSKRFESNPKLAEFVHSYINPEASFDDMAKILRTPAKYPSKKSKKTKSAWDKDMETDREKEESRATTIRNIHQPYKVGNQEFNEVNGEIELVPRDDYSSEEKRIFARPFNWTSSYKEYTPKDPTPPLPNVPSYTYDWRDFNTRYRTEMGVGQLGLKGRNQAKFDRIKKRFDIAQKYGLDPMSALPLYPDSDTFVALDKEGEGKHRGGATPDERGRAGEMRERYKVFDPNVPGNYKYRVTLPQDYVHNLNLIVHSNNNNAMGRMIMKYLEEVEANMPEWYKAHYAGKNSVMFQGQEVGIANKNEWTENKAEKAPFYQAYLDSLAPAPIKAPTTQGLISPEEQTPSEVDEEAREIRRIAQEADEEEDRQEAIRVAQQEEANEEAEAPEAPEAPKAPKAPEAPKAEVVQPDWVKEYPNKAKRKEAKKLFYEANPMIQRDGEDDDDYGIRIAQIQNAEEAKRIAEAEKARIAKEDKEAQYTAKEVEDTWTPEYKQKIKEGYEKLLVSVKQYVTELTGLYMDYEEAGDGLLDLIEAYKPNQGGAIVSVDEGDIKAMEAEVLRIEELFSRRYFVFSDFVKLFQRTLLGHYGNKEASRGTDWWGRVTMGVTIVENLDKKMMMMADKLADLMLAKGLQPDRPVKGKGVKAKPQSISGGNVPDRSSLQQMAKASYKASPPTMIGNSKLIKSTPGIKFYLNDRTIIVAIRGSQTQDDWLNANVRIPVNQLKTSNRFKQDSQIIREFQRQYPQGEYEYYGVGHSLGGALLDEFLREGLLDRGLSYNPAIQTQDFDNTNSKNERIYYEGDPLYNTLGLMLKNKPEVRKAPEKKWWEKALDYVPGYNNIISQGKSLLEGHDLDRFEGGKKSPKTLTPKNPVKAFKTQLENAGIEPSLYLKEAQRRAKEAGYPYRLLGYASDGSHKLAIPDANGRVIAFGKVKYGDHIIYEHMEKHNRVPKGTAQKKQNTFQKSHSKIKGDWKNNPFSPNALALKILW
jgi:hypothetical protein